MFDVLRVLEVSFVFVSNLDIFAALRAREARFRAAPSQPHNPIPQIPAAQNSADPSPKQRA